MVPVSLPQLLHRQASGTSWGVCELSEPQVPRKKGAWLVPCVVLVAASVLYCCGDRGCSRKAGTVFPSLGALALK